jgi:cell division septation protein DedD
MEIFISLVVAIGILITSTFFSNYQADKKEKEMQVVKKDLMEKNLRLSKAEAESNKFKDQLKDANDVIVILSEKGEPSKGPREPGERNSDTRTPDSMKSDSSNQKQSPVLENQSEKTRYEGNNFSNNRLGNKQGEDAEIYYTVMVATFNDLEKADSLAYKLKNKGYAVRVVYEKKTASPFKVYVGKFKSIKNAEQSAALLNRNEGLSTLIKPVR